MDDSNKTLRELAKALRAYADSPASSGTVPLYPATVRRIAADIERQSVRIAMLEGLVGEMREYFDQRADAEYDPSSPRPVGNEEMEYLCRIDRALTGDADNG